MNVLETTAGSSTEKITVKVKIWGIVQGVGFRPFVAKLADQMGMKGEVLNIGGLVDIVLTDSPARIDAFLTALQREKPEPAEIVHLKIERKPKQEFHEFTILQSDEGDDEAAMIPADLAICAHCVDELYDHQNPRYQHPFISCMICGPRYTIMDKIPYDRENTAMDEFPMCDFCEEQYTNRLDRRYHAQTISCHECGPMLACRLRQGLPGKGGGLESRGGGEMEDRLQVLKVAVQLLQQGEVIAFKGVGGYHLLCDPFCDRAVAALRKIKNREQKPFAVMFRSIEQIKQFCSVSEIEQQLLSSSARPIMLLERNDVKELNKLKGNLLKADASFADLEKSRFIGCFLPSMGGQYLLLDLIGQPLIATSANLSDLPIIKEEKEMFALMDQQPLIAATIYNERRINVRVDDSVVRVIDGQPQMIRRSKGYAPVPLYVDIQSTNEPSTKKVLEKEDMIFAAGGQLKSSFCLSKGSFAYVSQYFGDLDSVANEQIYTENVQRMEEFFRIEPRLAVCDLHPLYFTTKFTKAYAQERGIPLLTVQHHHAHVASVMAEHQLQGAVIGVSFDGTGYGTDGTIWGGEILLCEGSGFQRVAHLAPIKMLGGDSSMKEGWKSAMCYVYQAEQSAKTAREQTDVTQEQSELIHVDLREIIAFSTIRQHQHWPFVKAALEHHVNCIQSSSMGRLFDAVAALLGIQDENRYEGECAILLENAAACALKEPGKNKRDDLALQFHEQIADLILQQCQKVSRNYQTKQVALTGGVFQNKILMERSLQLLRQAGFEVYYNISVSPNDGGICFGQTYVAMQYLLGNGGNVCL